MAKNILVFADGTGNEGGLLPDESRTNVYKLYRATRTGPDSIIDPKKQLALYVPGIGTPTPGHDGSRARQKQTLQQMFGFGITEKIIDCYVALVGVWEPKDRIYLFGFSRGAYTARCLAHVLELCGIPTKERNGDSISLDPKSLREVAKDAVSCIYRLGMPRNEADAAKRAQEFRTVHASEAGCAAGASAYSGTPSRRSDGSGSFPIGRMIVTSPLTFNTRDTSNQSTRAVRISSGYLGGAAAR